MAWKCVCDFGVRILSYPLYFKETETWRMGGPEKRGKENDFGKGDMPDALVKITHKERPDLRIP